MNTFGQDSACCGEQLRTDRIGVTGVATLCFPLAIVLFALSPATFLLRGTAPGQILGALARANRRLIADTPLFPDLKCRASALLYRISPWLSGFTFRNFNFLVYLLASSAIATAVWGIWKAI